MDANNIQMSQFKQASPNHGNPRGGYGHNQMETKEPFRAGAVNHLVQNIGFHSTEFKSQTPAHHNGVDFIRNGSPLRQRPYPDSYQYTNHVYDQSYDVQHSPSRNAYGHGGNYNAGYSSDDYSFTANHYQSPGPVYDEHLYRAQNHPNASLPPSNAVDRHANYITMEGNSLYAQVNKVKTHEASNITHMTNEGQFVSYERAETQAQQATDYTDKQVGASRDIANPSEDVANEAPNQSDPVSLLSQSQPKSILKNKVTFDLPEQGTGSA